MLALGLAAAGCGAHAGTPRGAAGASTSAKANATTATATAAGRQVKIAFGDPARLPELAHHGVDLFEDVDRSAGTVGALLGAEGEAYLRRQGIAFTDAGRLDEHPFPAGYATYEAMAGELSTLASQHPQVARVVPIGRSLETEQGTAKRPILAVELTAHPDLDLPAVLFVGGQHARELTTVELSLRLVDHLAESYGRDPVVTKLLETRDVWIVPMANPDGHARVEAGKCGWRKNTRNNGFGFVGVDVDANYDDHFAQGEQSPGMDAFRGASPFSEPETRALRDLCKKQRFKTSLNLHSYGGAVMWPPGYGPSHTADEAVFRRVGDRLAQHIAYKDGTIAETLYPLYGDLSTWEYDTYGTLAFDVELADFAYTVPKWQLERDWNDWRDNMLGLIDLAGQPRR